MSSRELVDQYLREVEGVVRNISREEVCAVVDELFAAWGEGRTPMTAVANDLGYENVFTEPLKNFLPSRRTAT